MSDLAIPSSIAQNEQPLGRLNDLITNKRGQRKVVSSSKYIGLGQEGQLRITGDSGMRGILWGRKVPEARKEIHREAINQFVELIGQSFGEVGRARALELVQARLDSGKALSTREARRIANEAEQAFFHAQSGNLQKLAWEKMSGWYPEFVKELDLQHPVGLGQGDAFRGFTDAVFDRVERALLVAGRALTDEEIQGLIKRAAIEEHNLRSVEGLVKGWKDEYPDVTRFAKLESRILEKTQEEVRKHEGFGQRALTTEELQQLLQPMARENIIAFNRNHFETELCNSYNFTDLLAEFPKSEFSERERRMLKDLIVERALLDPVCEQRAMTKDEFREIARVVVREHCQERGVAFDRSCPGLREKAGANVDNPDQSPFNQVRRALSREVPEPQLPLTRSSKKMSQGEDLGAKTDRPLDRDKQIKQMLKEHEEALTSYDRKLRVVSDVLHEFEEAFHEGRFDGPPAPRTAQKCQRMLEKLDQLVESEKGLKVEGQQRFSESPTFQALRTEIERQMKKAKGEELAPPKPLLEQGPPPEPVRTPQTPILAIPPNLRLSPEAPDPDQFRLGQRLEKLNLVAEERIRSGESPEKVSSEIGKLKDDEIGKWKRLNLIPARGGLKQPKPMTQPEVQSTGRRINFSVQSERVPEMLKQDSDLPVTREDVEGSVTKQQSALPRFRTGAGFPIYDVHGLKQELEDQGKKMSKNSFEEIQQARRELFDQRVFHEGMRQALAGEGITFSDREAKAFFDGMARLHHLQLRDIPKDPEERSAYERELRECEKLSQDLTFMLYDKTNREDRPNTLVDGLCKDLRHLRIELREERERLGFVREGQSWDDSGCGRLSGSFTDMVKTPGEVRFDEDLHPLMRLDSHRGRWVIGSNRYPEGYDKDVSREDQDRQFIQALQHEITVAFPTATEEERAQLLRELSSLVNHSAFGVQRMDLQQNPGEVTQFPLAGVLDENVGTRYEIVGQPGRLLVRMVHTEEPTHMQDLTSGEEQPMEPGGIVQESLRLALHRDEDGLRVEVLKARIELSAKPTPKVAPQGV